jgi:hypothetical protein
MLVGSVTGLVLPLLTVETIEVWLAQDALVLKTTDLVLTAR